MMARPWIAPFRGRAFTLVELLVSMAIFVVLVLVVFSMTDQVGRAWRGTTGSIEQWQSARAGFESMTRRISQATLNTTWAYFTGPNGTGGLTMSDPRSYGRYSELHFIADRADALLGGPGSPLSGALSAATSALFFQAPLGQTGEPHPLPHLLNSCGFYIAFNSDTDFLPKKSLFSRVTPRRRFRLMELVVPSEKMTVYASSDPAAPGYETNYDWFQEPIRTGFARPLADNVVALFILPHFSRFDTSSGALLAPHYRYNSRSFYAFSDPDTGIHGNTLHQLPPLLEVTMVAIDEGSAVRLDEHFRGQADAMTEAIFRDAAFTNAASFKDDLRQLEANLRRERMTYRVYTSVIGIRGAKWSGDFPEPQ